MYLYTGYTQKMVRIQNLTRNLYHILHGQNVHHQQHQMSKFLIRYQQFASHAYCGAAGPFSKMASQQENAFCVLRFKALEGGEWSAARLGRTLPPGKIRYPFYRRLVGPQGRSRRMRKISSPPGFDPGPSSP